MSLTLSSADEAMRDGAHGEAVAFAMQVILAMADVQRATSLLDITHAHIDSTVYVGEATLEYAERLAAMGAQVRVPTTLNVSGLDEHGWKGWSVPPVWASKAYRQMVAYQSMGAIPTWTCAPYQTPHGRPALGQQVAWGESNAIAFANSVLGARTERYPDLLDVCCAITGRAPAAGLHLTERRAATVEVRLIDIPPLVQEDDAFYPVLGAALGKLAGDEVPVVVGLTARPGDDALKAVCAAAASTGAVALFHIVGVTPEAPTLDEACQGRAPSRTVDLTLNDILRERTALTTARGETLDLVILGSPHFSFDEFRRLSLLLEGRRKAPHVRFLVTSSRFMRDLARDAGLLTSLEAFGGEVTVDTCILTTPMLPASIRCLMTNSGKYAYYAPGLLGTTVTFGSLRDCVTSAELGSVDVDLTGWQA